MVMTVRFLLLWLVLLLAAVGALLGLLAVTRQRVAVTQRAAGAHAQRAADAAHAAVARVHLRQLLIHVLELVDARLQLVGHLAQLLHRANVLHVDAVLKHANAPSPADYVPHNVASGVTHTHSKRVIYSRKSDSI